MDNETILIVDDNPNNLSGLPPMERWLTAVSARCNYHSGADCIHCRASRNNRPSP